jgi:hypothetical protein
MQTRTSFTLFVAILTLATACGDTTGPSSPSPLAGLGQVSARDTVGNPITTTPNGTGDGAIRGTVLGPSAPGAGNDSLQTAPKLAGVRVAIMGITGGTDAQPTLGAELGAATTGNDGTFALPTVPAGRYAVSFSPPSGSAYQGVWASAAVDARSAASPWWVVLPRK